MEILGSTDLIGEEIKEEARKKAASILKNADEEIERIKAKAKEKIAKLEAEQTNIYLAKAQEYKNDVFVRLPLKKFKERIEYVEHLFNSASEKYFASLDVNSKLFVIKTVLKKYKQVLQESTIVVKFADLPKEKVARLVSSVFPESNIKEIREATVEEVRRSSLKQGVIIEDEMQTFSCKASLESAKNELFDKMKSELCYALCGL